MAMDKILELYPDIDSLAEYIAYNCRDKQNWFYREKSLQFGNPKERNRLFFAEFWSTREVIDNMSKENPALEYCKDKAQVDISHYLDIAAKIHTLAEKSSEEFIAVLNGNHKTKFSKPTDLLIHLFFDGYLMAICHKSLLPFNPDISSALIDGLHIEYYGIPSDRLEGGIIELLATKPECFFLTLIDSVENDRGMHALVPGIIAYCIDGKGDVGIDIFTTQILFKAFLDVSATGLKEIEQFIELK
jgi:hypothetical protein